MGLPFYAFWDMLRAAEVGTCQTGGAAQEGERASSLLPHEDNPADKGKGLRTQKKGKAGAGRGQGKAKKLSLLGPTALARGELRCLNQRFMTGQVWSSLLLERSCIVSGRA